MNRFAFVEAWRPPSTMDIIKAMSKENVPRNNNNSTPAHKAPPPLLVARAERVSFSNPTPEAYEGAFLLFEEKMDAHRDHGCPVIFFNDSPYPRLMIEMEMWNGPQNVSLQSRLIGIVQKFHLEPGVVLTAAILLERLLHTHGGLTVQGNNVHRLMLTSLLAASKVSKDEPFSNTYWAQHFGVTLNDVWTFETEFYAFLDWDLVITTEDMKNATEDADRLFTHATEAFRLAASSS